MADTTAVVAVKLGVRVPTPACNAVHTAVALEPALGAPDDYLGLHARMPRKKYARQYARNRPVRGLASRANRGANRCRAASPRAAAMENRNGRYPRRYPPRSCSHQLACAGENHGKGQRHHCAGGAPVHEPITVRLVAGLVSTGNTITGNSSAGYRVHGVSNGCSQMDVFPAPGCRRRGVGEL